MLKENKLIESQNNSSQIFRVSDYSAELFDINFKKINKTIIGFISPEDDILKMKLKINSLNFYLKKILGKISTTKEI